jgi:hypothetical protein
MNGLLDLLGRMMRLPLTGMVFTMERMTAMVDGVDRATREGWDEVLRRLDAGSPGARPSFAVPRNAPAVPGGPRGRASPGRPPGPGAGAGEAREVNSGVGEPYAATDTKEGMKVPDTNLSDDMVKLVRYSVVSIKRDQEKPLLVGEEKVFDDNLDGEAFTTWVTSEVAGAEGLSEEDRKYLRVSYEVLGRWPKQDRKYEKRQLEQLEGIQRAIENL